MSVVRAQPQFCRGAAAREPLAVRAWHHPIPATVQQEDRRNYLRRVGPPRGDVGQVVVYEPPGPASTAGPTTLFSQDHAP